MRTTRTVLVLSEVEREQSLLKSLLHTFGHRPDVSWQYSDEGIADIVVLSVDKPSPTLLLQAEKLAKVVIFYAATADLPLLINKAFVLPKPTRARDLLEMIEQVEAHFADRARAHQPLGARTAGQTEATTHSAGLTLVF